MTAIPTIDQALVICEGLIEQRDTLYTRTVHPRRDVERALAAIEAGRYDEATGHLEDAKRDLHDLADLYLGFVTPAVD